MTNKYNSAGIALRIWIFTSLIFGISWITYILLFENATIIWTALPATIVAAIGSLPVLVAVFASLYFIKKSTNSLQNKYQLLIATCLLSELPYAAIGGGLFSRELMRFGIDSYLISFIICYAILFGASAIAMVLINKKIIQFFSTTKTNQTMVQDSFQTDSNLPASNHSNNSNKTVIKGLITGALTLLMLIPALFVMNLVTEREQRQKEVTQEISSKWAAPQTLTGPYLYLPYKVTVEYKDGKTGVIDKSLFLLPENLQVSGTITPETRSRSIYTVLLYKSDIKNTGNFLLQLPKDITPAMVNFSEAKVCFGIRDFKGIQEKITIRLNGSSYELSPGLPSKEKENISADNNSNSVQVNDMVERTTGKEIETIGLSSNINLSAADIGKSIAFDMPVKINGSEQLHFVPLAGNSSFSLTSTWADPKFDGNNLPASRNVGPQGFTAKWNFNKANLPFGTTIKDFDFKKEPFAFGVTMVQPADQYAKTMRSVKYAILFIGLTFALFFIIELMQKNPVHPVQYVLVGLALVIFFTLLLSISEFILFDFAYLIAAAATILLITMYAKSHFRSIKTALVFGTVLSCLYSFIFVLIRLEDTALLVGSIGLFIVLAIVMYASRKIQCYGNGSENTNTSYN
jgi:inner membrane protein